MSTGSIDSAALKRKYTEERDKRLVAGNRSFIDPLQVFPEFERDPWVQQRLERGAIVEEVDVAVTGTGIAGMLAAARLRKAGVDSFRMIDVAGDFGGVWYWNRYPGIRCDVESYIYLPLIEEIGTLPTERYSTGEEIREHCRAFARHFDLYPRALLQTRIASATWDERSERWQVATDRGDLIKARFLIGTSGYQHFPKVPKIPGMKSFKGRMFHPSRWDFDFTGGSPAGNLSGLKGKKVALVGTGATGIQILPHLAKSAEVTYVILRTPPAVAARNNRPTDVNWFRTLKPGWQLERMDNFYAITSGENPEVDLLDDCWTRQSRKFGKATAGLPRAAIAQAYQLADFELMEEVRSRVEQIVQDPATAAALKPWYNLYCKRPLYADDFLESFNEPAVRLLDTDGRGVERISESGLVVNGRHYDVDCIILASGFRVGAYQRNSSTFPICGRGGESLAEKWSDGVRSVHGLWMHGFPNFQLVGSIFQAVSSFNYTWLTDRQAIHAAEIVARALREGIRSIEVTEAAEEAWSRAVASTSRNAEFFKECTPGYFNNEGDTSRTPLYATTYGGGAARYFDLLRQWRDAGFRDDCIVR